MMCSDKFCRGQLKKSESYHRYYECGLSNVVILNCPSLICNYCGKAAMMLPPAEMAGRLISRDLLRLWRPLNGDEISFVLREAGLRHSRLARIMGVSRRSAIAWLDDKRRMRKGLDTHFRLKMAGLIFSRGRRTLRREIRKVFSENYRHDAKNKINIQFQKKGDRWNIITRYVVNGR